MDLASRFTHNPIIAPTDVPPIGEGMRVICTMNPGAFRWRGKTGLIVRVAQQPTQVEGFVRTAIMDPSAPQNPRVLTFDLNDEHLTMTDPRIFAYKGEKYLTSISHLRLAWSTDGENFTLDTGPPIAGNGPMEEYGIEDCRVSRIGERFYLTYTAVSRYGAAVGLMTTEDWRSFTPMGVILPPHNKDVALFDRTFDGLFKCLHRPMGSEVGGPYIWVSSSNDLLSWGAHRCIARTRAGMWDEERIGAGAAPVMTNRGWLMIYHGADRNHRYCLGAMLLDPDDPAVVIARSRQPIMEPIMEYERKGFFGNVVFTNGHVVDGDRLTVYYGASDSLVCGAYFSIEEILSHLD